MVVWPAPTSKVRVADPAVAPSVDKMTFVGSRLVTVTWALPGGAPAPSDPPRRSCRVWAAIGLAILIGGALMVAVIRCKLVGVEKPAGVPTVIVVVPPCRGSNA